MSPGQPRTPSSKQSSPGSLEGSNLAPSCSSCRTLASPPDPEETGQRLKELQEPPLDPTPPQFSWHPCMAPRSQQRGHLRPAPSRWCTSSTTSARPTPSPLPSGMAYPLISWHP